MYIFLARHAQCEGNRDRKIVGRSADTELTEVGMLQAVQLGELLRDSNAGRILCSTTKRAEQTALLMRFRLKEEIPIEKHSFLDEIDVGMKLDNVSLSAQESDEYWYTLEKWMQHKLMVGFDGGERLIDVLNRQCDFLSYLDSLCDASVIVISHKTYLQLFVWYFVFNGINIYSAQDESFVLKQGAFFTLLDYHDHNFAMISFNSCSPVGVSR